MRTAATSPCFLAVPLPTHRRVYRSIPLCMRSQPQNQATPDTPSLPSFPVTPLSPLFFRGRKIFVKRDDLLIHHSIRGSKLRKFHSLLSPSVLPEDSVVISYGGVQSNAMLALAQLCAVRELPFYYITRRVSPTIAELPGNFTDALGAGMTHVSIPSEVFRGNLVDVEPDCATASAKRFVAIAHSDAFHTGRAVVVPQGGAWPLAELGLRELASELRGQIEALQLSGELSSRKPLLFLACGTGTTAYYLAKHLEDCVSVFAVPVSGDERYLARQMRRVAALEGLSVILPGIIRPRLRGSFADVRPEKLAIWKELKRAAGTYDFDLVYAPKAWEETMCALEQGRIGTGGEDLIYYHSGGVEGNVSMLDRFRQKGLLSTT